MPNRLIRAISGSHEAISGPTFERNTKNVIFVPVWCTTPYTITEWKQKKLEGQPLFLNHTQYRNETLCIYFSIPSVFWLVNFTWLLSKSKKQRNFLDRKCFIEALAVVRKSKHNVLMIRLRISWLCKNMHKMVGHVKNGDNKTY